jgi:23S rRNA (adenine2503-C2)-methyltransferase
LTSGEIISQLLTMQNIFKKENGPLKNSKDNNNKIITNVVFMGQGEPFFNYLNVAAALKLLLDESAFALSKRKITVSTSGVVPKIIQFGNDFPGVGLAISLHATNNELRSQIVTANQQWPIEELLRACKNHPKISEHNPVTFEYVMLKGVNDTDAEARELGKMLYDFPSKVNLIPFNPWPGTIYESSSNNRIHDFARVLDKAGVPATIRRSRGSDILAACGQLATKKGIK